MSTTTGTTTNATTRPVEVFARDTPGTILQTERLVLRPAVVADSQALTTAIDALIQDGDTTSGVHLPGERTASIVTRQLELTTKGVSTGGALRRVVIDRAKPGSILGCCNLTVIERGLEWYAELAFWLVPRARGRGLAQESCAAVVEHAFEDLPGGLGMTAVRGFVQPDNTAAQRVLSAIGFTRTVGSREHLDVGGHQRPHELWSKSVTA